MANYINKTILSESYAHIEIEQLSAEQTKEFLMDIKAYQGPRAKRMLGADIEPMARTEEGSLKVYLTVYGSLADALGEFDDFREALQTLYTSSKMVADACNLESLFLAGGVKKDLVRAEARTGVVKSTRDLLDRAIYLGTSLERLGQRRIKDAIAELAKKVTILNKNLTLARDRALVWNNILPVLAKLPASIHRLQVTPDAEFTKDCRGALNDIVKEARGYLAQSESNSEI